MGGASYVTTTPIPDTLRDPCIIRRHRKKTKPNQSHKLRTHGDGVDARLGDGRGLLQGEWCGHEGLHAVFVLLVLWVGV